MAKYLNLDGLQTLWTKFKTTFVPTTRTINGKSLSSNVALTGMDIPIVPGEAEATVYEYLQGTEQLGNKVTSWSSTTTDDNYPSEKLVKTALDGKANDLDVVHKTGSETIAGEKTFSSTIKGSVSGSASSLTHPSGTTKGYVETDETNTGCRLKLCDSSNHELRLDSFGSSETKWRMSVFADNTGTMTKQVMLVDKTTGGAEFFGNASSATSATTALNYSADGGIDNAIKEAIRTSKDYSDANLKLSAKLDWADSQMSFSVGFNTKLSTVERYLYGSTGAAVQGLNTYGFKYLLLVTVYFSGKIKNSGVLTLEMYEGASSSTATLVCRTTLFLYKDSAGNCTDQQITAFLRYNGSYSGTSNNRYVQFRIDSNGSRDTSVATGFTLAINAKIFV